MFHINKITQRASGAAGSFGGAAFPRVICVFASPSDPLSFTTEYVPFTRIGHNSCTPPLVNRPFRLFQHMFLFQGKAGSGFARVLGKVMYV